LSLLALHVNSVLRLGDTGPIIISRRITCCYLADSKSFSATKDSCKFHSKIVTLPTKKLLDG